MTSAAAAAADEALTAGTQADSEGGLSARSSDDVDSETEGQTSSVPGTASGPMSKLQIHGFLTQAYATGHFQDGRFPNPDGTPAGPTLEEKVLGIPDGGTTDYRFLALQFRYQISEKDVMVMQFSHAALGISPVDELKDEITLDWAFYERRISDYTSLKVGRIPIAFGIFNEVRDVGTILPFYRPAFVFYREGSAATEAVDGVNISHSFWPLKDWNLDADLYAGEWGSFDLIPTENQAVPSRSKNSWGTWWWLNTPVSGLRFGWGFQRQNIGEGLEGIIRPVGGTTRLDSWFASLDAAFDRVVFRAEGRFIKSDPSVVPALGINDFVNKNEIFYLQLGYFVTDKFRIFLQWENFDWSFETALFTETRKYTPRVDYGIALNYLIASNIVVKAEYHMVEGEDSALVPVPFNQPPFFRLQPIYSDLTDGDYTIISLSTSF